MKPELPSDVKTCRSVGKALASDFVPELLRASAVGWYSAVVGLLGLVASIVAGLLWTTPVTLRCFIKVRSWLLPAASDCSLFQENATSPSFTLKMQVATSRYGKHFQQTCVLVRSKYYLVSSH
jgi:hypothetical protein